MNVVVKESPIYCFILFDLILQSKAKPHQKGTRIHEFKKGRSNFLQHKAIPVERSNQDKQCSG